MKYIYCVFSVLCLFQCGNGSKPMVSGEVINERPILDFSQDSGYICKKDILPFLLSESLTDTLNGKWAYINDLDTVGKYYHWKDSCILISVDEDGSPILLDLNFKGELLQSRKYYHGNYNICTDKYGGLNKIGNYYTLTVCGTGLAYGTTYSYLFRDNFFEEDGHSIPQDSYYYMGELSYQLNSRLKFVNDTTILMHYTLNKGELNDDLKFRIRSTQRFEVEYIFDHSHNNWLMKDSTKFEQYGLDL